ncbi:hypothetical protein EW145_g3948 [Phellinidium pouzarii]|uniref:Uncharacterized protein n=1 Tax=Phellinidium pouzarii TaxID=167371 RepID=A0A4S4L5J5_9AGAM|nr:hypothetical protein EW145_g3948 [Phellinidium pouzarii]
MPHTPELSSTAQTPPHSASSRSTSRHHLAFSLALAGTFFPLAHASVFITHPYAGISCRGGSACSLTWVDDGEAPLLAAIGACDFGLYQGADTLVQQLVTGLDVSRTRELSFIPDPNAGPDSDS